MNKLDGDGKYTPRPYQADFYKWFDANWGSGKSVALISPTGTGKTSMLRTLQRGYQGVYVNPTNILCRQVKENYPDVNLLLGKQHYRCDSYKTSCAYVQARELTCRKCDQGGCPLDVSREKFFAGEDSVTNTAVLWQMRKIKESNLVLADEGDTVLSLMKQLTHKKMKLGKPEHTLLKKLGFTYQDLIKDAAFHAFLAARLDAVRAKLAKTPDDERLVFEEYAMDVQLSSFEANPQLMVRYPDAKALTYFNVFIPDTLKKGLLGHRSVLASGTLYPVDLLEIYGSRDNYSVYEVPPVIPIDNRPIIYKPSTFRHNYADMDYKKLAATIVEIYENNGKLNTMVHTTYAGSAELETHLKDLGIKCFLYTEAKEKQTVIGQFIEAASKSKTGNLLIAAGAAEGIDLKDDLCRVNIVTKILYPNLNDQYVRKRMALEDGDEWQTTRALRTLIQSVGRSTRGAEDYSVTYVLDNTLPLLLQKAKKYNILHESILSSFVFSQNQAARIERTFFK